MSTGSQCGADIGTADAFRAHRGTRREARKVKARTAETRTVKARTAETPVRYRDRFRGDWIAERVGPIALADRFPDHDMCPPYRGVYPPYRGVYPPTCSVRTA